MKLTPEMTIKEIWTSFKDVVIPKDAGKTQLTEMKRAFYAGAGMVSNFIHLIIDYDKWDDDQKTKKLIENTLEFQKFRSHPFLDEGEFDE